MGLFQKKTTNTSSVAPLYTLDSQETVLLVGLGNIGKKYNRTRHNVGFDALDAFVDAQDELRDWVDKKDLGCLFSSGTLGNCRVICIKPTTFMNESGRSTQAVQHFYKVPSSSTVVIYDDLDLPFGQIRMRSGGSSAGHNGIKSIITNSDDIFHRVRIGINSPHRTKNEEKDFVLKKFSSEEQKHLKDLNKEVVSILTEYIFSGNLPAETRSFLA